MATVSKSKEKFKDKPATQQALEEMRHGYEELRARLDSTEEVNLTGGETF